MMRKTCASLALVLLAAGATACGSSSDNSKSGAAAATVAADAPAKTTAATADASATPSAQPNVAQAAEAAPGSGKGITIGYLSNKESVPIVHAISEGIRAQAKRAGVNLVFCDGNGDNATALNCAKTFKQKKVQGIINFQHDTKAAPSICGAGPADVPVFAVDIPQPPCQTSFMGVDNAYGGQVAGEALGQYFKNKQNCKYDAWVSLEEPEIGQPNEQRMGGYRTGFEKACGPVHDLKKVAFDASADQARSKMADVLTTLPSAKTIIVTSIDDEGVEGAFAAAKAAGRDKQLFAASLGMADDVGRCGIKNNPNWVAATAIFPEKYGWVGIPYMIKAIKGETVGKDLFVPLVALTTDNIGKYYSPSC